MTPRKPDLLELQIGRIEKVFSVARQDLNSLIFTSNGQI
jgi:hypothetical protein